LKFDGMEIKNGNDFELLLSYRQIQQIQQYATEIIENLPPKALDELLGGYFYDQEDLLNEIFYQVNSVLQLGSSLKSEKLGYLEDLEKSMDMTLRKLSYNYFKTTCLPTFHQGWRNLEWGNLVQLFPWSLFLAARGHGKSFEWTFAFVLWRLRCCVESERRNREKQRRGGQRKESIS